MPHYFFAHAATAKGKFLRFRRNLQQKKYLPLNDTEYPYAGIPRIVIETENRSPVKDRKNEIPAKLQIWGEHAPESEVMDMTIRGRGNSTRDMPKKGYKIEFVDKQAVLEKPAQNNFKRWDTPYATYDEAVHELRNWVAIRFIWIDQEQKKNSTPVQ